MLNLDLHQLTHTGTGGRQIPHDKVPFKVRLLHELVLQEGVVSVADDVLQVGALLHLHRFQLQPGMLGEFQVLVDGLNAKVHCLGFEILHQVILVGKQVPLVKFLLVSKEILYCEGVRRDGVVGHVLLTEE